MNIACKHVAVQANPLGRRAPYIGLPAVKLVAARDITNK